MQKKLLLLLLFLTAFVFRILLVPIAHHGDLNNNISWATEAREKGLRNLYEKKDWAYSAPNQPPLYILTFAFFTYFYQPINSFFWKLNSSFSAFPSKMIWYWERTGVDFLVKLPGILADIGIGIFIYKYLKKNKKTRPKASFFTFIWLFNPLVWYNSAVWGQTDSLVNFLGLLAILTLVGSIVKKKKEWRLEIFALFLTLSVLFKASLVIFLPILFVYALSQKYPLASWLRSLLVSSITIFVIGIWFHPEADFLVWFFELWKNRILPGEIGYLTANAFNFWWLVDSGKTLDSTIFFGLPARAWGLFVISVGVILIARPLYNRKKIKPIQLFYALILVSLLSFLFLTRVHERYLYPFFPIGTLLIGFSPQFGIFYALLSFTYLANMYHLFWVPDVGFLKSLYDYKFFSASLAVVNIFTFFYLLSKYLSGEMRKFSLRVKNLYN